MKERSGVVAVRTRERHDFSLHADGFGPVIVLGINAEASTQRRNDDLGVVQVKLIFGLLPIGERFNDKLIDAGFFKFVFERPVIPAEKLSRMQRWSQIGFAAVFDHIEGRGFDHCHRARFHRANKAHIELESSLGLLKDHGGIGKDEAEMSSGRQACCKHAGKQGGGEDAVKHGVAFLGMCVSRRGRSAHCLRTIIAFTEVLGQRKVQAPIASKRVHLRRKAC